MVTMLASLLGSVMMILTFACPPPVECASAIDKWIIKRFTRRQTVVVLSTPNVENDGKFFFS
jgi:hypothetical protein